MIFSSNNHTLFLLFVLEIPKEDISTPTNLTSVFVIVDNTATSFLERFDVNDFTIRTANAAVNQHLDNITSCFVDKLPHGWMTTQFYQLLIFWVLKMTHLLSVKDINIKKRKIGKKQYEFFF